MKTVFACLFLTLLLALTPEDHQATAAMPGPKGCYDPADYGAIPDDDVSDRVPAQQALDAASATGGRVCFGAGVWTLTRAPVGSYNRFAALSTHGQHVEISGEGPNTVLRIGGDQGGSATFGISLDPGASDIRLRDFVIDTSGMTNTDEQTHAIAIGTGVCTSANGTCSMPVVDVSVERIRFVHPGLPGFRKGDCIRLFGNTAATEVLRTKIIGNTFTDCARSDVAVQRNVNSLTVIGNHFASPRVDQHIDGEASGGEGDKRIQIIGNTFDSPGTTQGDYAVALTSYKYAVISGNVFNGRGLSLYRSTDSAVTGNVFDTTFKTTSHGVIEVGNVSDRTVIANNVIYRRGAAGTGIRVTPHSGGMPSELLITDNSITNETDGAGIYMESPQDVTISNNSIRFPTPTANTMGVMLRAISRPIDGVIISNNRIVGALYAGVRLSASPQPFVDVTLTGNQVRGSNFGLRCEGTGGFQPIISVGNKWGPKVCSATIITGEGPLVDPSVQVVEVRQRSVTEDPAVMGDFPNGWLVADAGAGLPQPPSDDLELPEFIELFENTRAPGVVEEDLSPGATRSVSLQVAGLSGLAGSARWVGTISPLNVILSLDGLTLATGTAYHFGTNRGGSYLQARTTAGGLATMSVTNTSDVTVKVRIVFAATGL